MWVNKMKIGRILYCAAACIPSRRAAFAATVALFAALGAQATTYWLGTGNAASDANPGTDINAPLASWNAAFAKAGEANGNVLNILPGTYTLSEAPATWSASRTGVTIQGVDSEGNPITSSDGASAVVVDGNGLGTIAPVRASLNMVFSGITFQDGKGASSSGAAIGVDRTGSSVTEQGFVVSNCVFSACTGGPAVYCKALGGAVFVGCKFTGNANAAASATCIAKENPKSGCPLVVESCTFESNSGSGQSTDGSGVCINSTSEMHVSDSTFTGNTNSARGVVFCFNGTAVSNHVERCAFANNANEASVTTSGLAGSGGVAYGKMQNTTNVFESCTFDGNSAAGGGGCISLRYGRLVAEDCTFTGNSAAHGSALVYSYQNSGSSAVFNRCTISGNVATSSDGAIARMGAGCSLNLSESVVSGNTYSATSSSGGIVLQTADSAAECCMFQFNTTPALASGASVGTHYLSALYATAGTVENCLVVCNTNLLSHGAGIYSNGSGVSVVNCTVAGNRTANAYAGIYPSSTENSVRNCIFADNVNPDDSSKVQLMNYVAFQYCFADANVTAANWTGRTGNILSPSGALFADAAAGDWTLAKSSVCRDAGTNAPWTDDGTAAGTLLADVFDLAGKARIVGDTVDIGCYEWFSENKGLSIIVR